MKASDTHLALPFGEPALGYRIARWKRDIFCRFLKQSRDQVAFSDSRRSVIQQCHKEGRVCFAWAADVDHELRKEAELYQVRLILVEDGFIRSIGLGAGFVPPASMVFDPIGIYFDARSPSGLETLIENGWLTRQDVDRAVSLRTRLLADRLSKYNAVGRDIQIDLPKDRDTILIVGQVEDDASIRCGLGNVRTNHTLLQTVRERVPDGYLVYKPHPDVEAGFRKGHVPRRICEKYMNQVLTNVSSTALLDQVQQVHTISSLLGFEAMLRKLPVFTYGSPFYAGWGLSDDQVSLPRRTRKPTLEELIAATLISYPAYIDPVSEELCDVERLVDSLSLGVGVSEDLRFQERLRRIWRRAYGFSRRHLRKIRD